MKLVAQLSSALPFPVALPPLPLRPLHALFPVPLCFQRRLRLRRRSQADAYGIAVWSVAKAMAKQEADMAEAKVGQPNMGGLLPSCGHRRLAHLAAHLDATMVNSMSLVRLRVSRAPRSGIAPFKLPLPSDWLVK